MLGVLRSIDCLVCPRSLELVVLLQQVQVLEPRSSFHSCLELVQVLVMFREHPRPTLLILLVLLDQNYPIRQ